MYELWCYCGGRGERPSHIEYSVEQNDKGCKMKWFVRHVLSVVLSACSFGFVLPKLWLWFVIPIFHLMPLTFFMAIGLHLTVCLFRPVIPQITPDMLTDEVAKTRVLDVYRIFCILAPWSALVFGWIVHCFM